MGAAVGDRLQAAVEALSAAGARIDDGARPGVELSEAMALYDRLLAPLVSTSLSDEQLIAIAQTSGAQGEALAERAGGFVRAATLRHRDWLALDDERRRQRARWAEFFVDFDVCSAQSCRFLRSPTTSTSR